MKTKQNKKTTGCKRVRIHDSREEFKISKSPCAAVPLGVVGMCLPILGRHMARSFPQQPGAFCAPPHVEVNPESSVCHPAGRGMCFPSAAPVHPSSLRVTHGHHTRFVRAPGQDQSGPLLKAEIKNIQNIVKNHTLRFL